MTESDKGVSGESEWHTPSRDAHAADILLIKKGW